MHTYIAIMAWMMALSGNVWLNPVTLLIGAWFPDTDHRGTIQGKLLPLWAIARHRGFVHSLPGMLVFTLPFYFFMSPWSAASFAVGYFSHLFFDACTPMGINWLGIRKAPPRRRRRAS